MLANLWIPSGVFIGMKICLRIKALPVMLDFTRQHYNSKLATEILEKRRIGTLHPDDYAEDISHR